jgi:hypothetical protein
MVDKVECLDGITVLYDATSVDLRSSLAYDFDIDTSFSEDARIVRQFKSYEHKP